MTEPGKSNAAEAAQAYQTLMKVSGEGALVDAKTKKLMSVALSISQHCEPCLLHHAKSALEQGINRAELEEVAMLVTSFTGCTGLMFYREVMRKLGNS